MEKITNLNLRQSNFIEKLVQDQYDQSSADMEKTLGSQHVKDQFTAILSALLGELSEDRTVLKDISIGMWDQHLSAAAVVNRLWDGLGVSTADVPGKILEHFDLLDRVSDVETIVTEAGHRAVKDKLVVFIRRTFMELATSLLRTSESTSLKTKVPAPLVSAFTIAETKAMWSASSDSNLSTDQIKELNALSNAVSDDAKKMVSKFPEETLERETAQRLSKHPGFTTKDPEFVNSVMDNEEVLQELISGSSEYGLQSDFKDDLYEAYFVGKFYPEKFTENYEKTPELKTFLEVAYYTSVEAALDSRVSSMIKKLVNGG